MVSNESSYIVKCIPIRAVALCLWNSADGVLSVLDKPIKQVDPCGGAPESRHPSLRVLKCYSKSAPRSWYMCASSKYNRHLFLSFPTEYYLVRSCPLAEVITFKF